MFSQCNFVQTYQTVPKTACFREGLTSKFIKAVVELNNSTDIGSARILPNLLHTNLQDFKNSMFFVRPSAFEAPQHCTVCLATVWWAPLTTFCFCVACKQ